MGRCDNLVLTGWGYAEYVASAAAALKRLVAAQNLKEVWTYSIITKETSPTTYRRDYWDSILALVPSRFPGAGAVAYR